MSSVNQFAYFTDFSNLNISGTNADIYKGKWHFYSLIKFYVMHLKNLKVKNLIIVSIKNKNGFYDLGFSCDVIGKFCNTKKYPSQIKISSKKVYYCNSWKEHQLSMCQENYIFLLPCYFQISTVLFLVAILEKETSCCSCANYCRLCIIKLYIGFIILTLELNVHSITGSWRLTNYNKDVVCLMSELIQTLHLTTLCRVPFTLACVMFIQLLALKFNK